MKSPIFDGLYKYAKMQRIPFNAPGHKGKVTMRARNLSMLDLYGSSKDGDALNLRELTALSEDEISKKYKTCRSMYLRNGATGGIYAMLAAYLRRGDKVIVDRECHRSVINALITAVSRRKKDEIAARLTELENIWHRHGVYETRKSDAEDVNG